MRCIAIKQGGTQYRKSSVFAKVKRKPINLMVWNINRIFIG